MNTFTPNTYKVNLFNKFNKRPRVLLVDDDEGLRTLMSSFLSNYCDVEVRTDALQALSYLHKGGKADVIILDQDLNHFRGDQILGILRDSGYFRNLPVLIIGESFPVRVLDLCRRLGPAHCLKKPFDPNQLREKIFSFTA